MGPPQILGLLLLALFDGGAVAVELAPVAHVPPELRHYWRPEEFDRFDDSHEHKGFVRVRERLRRAPTGRETLHEDYTWTVPNYGGADCILVQTECTFLINYRTLRYGVKTAKIDLPHNVNITGSCVSEDGDTAIISLHWSVFNFTLVFTENPEGNSYFLNKGILRYYQTLDLFDDATYRGLVILETRRDKNFYFTPLGRSYQCRHGEDQGPLPLFNVDDEIVGNMTLYNTWFQPFVKRAKGDWGPADHCLPKSIQIMREDVVPFIVSSIFLFSCSLLVLGYALWRKLSVKKTQYGFYGDSGPPDGAGGGEVFEAHEMTQQQPQITNGFDHQQQEQLATNGHQQQQQQQQQQKPAAAANPFRNEQQTKVTTNPFNQ